MSTVKPPKPIDETAFSRLTPAERLVHEIDAIMAHLPELDTALKRVSEVMAGPTSALSPRLAELVRLRIAFFNQCRTCMSLRYAPDQVSEGLICSLEKPEDAKDLSNAEKAALRFAERMATDHLSITPAMFDDLRKYFEEKQIVELSVACALHVGFGRMAATWQMYEHLHERFHQKQDAPYTPWGEGGLVVAPI
jgi:alkylhydroperoxidase family enzyme